MGIEYPVLAFIASLVFITMVFTALFVYIYVMGNISRIPVVTGYGDIRVLFNTSTVQVRLIHQRGEPVTLEQILLNTDIGQITCRLPGPDCRLPSGVAMNITLVGFIGTTVPPGSSPAIYINIVSDRSLFTNTSRTYSMLLLFDKGTLHIELTITYKMP